ncbi:hypothetical protein KI387_017739, partial [Taxus chinensis]
MEMGGFVLLMLFVFLIQQWCRTEAYYMAGHGLRSRYIIVDNEGRGHFGSVQAAVDSVRDGNRARVVIEIRPGFYEEKVIVPATKPYITLQGWGNERTVLEWHNKASDTGPDGQELHTYNTASVTVLANHFTAKNITFRNSAPAPFAWNGRMAGG